MAHFCLNWRINDLSIETFHEIGSYLWISGPIYRCWQTRICSMICQVSQITLVLTFAYILIWLGRTLHRKSVDDLILRSQSVFSGFRRSTKIERRFSNFIDFAPIDTRLRFCLKILLSWDWRQLRRFGWHVLSAFVKNLRLVLTQLIYCLLWWIARMLASWF